MRVSRACASYLLDGEPTKNLHGAHIFEGLSAYLMVRAIVY